MPFSAAPRRRPQSLRRRPGSDGGMPGRVRPRRRSRRAAERASSADGRARRRRGAAGRRADDGSPRHGAGVGRGRLRAGAPAWSPDSAGLPCRGTAVGLGRPRAPATDRRAAPRDGRRPRTAARTGTDRTGYSQRRLLAQVPLVVAPAAHWSQPRRSRPRP